MLPRAIRLAGFGMKDAAQRRLTESRLWQNGCRKWIVMMWYFR